MYKVYTIYIRYIYKVYTKVYIEYILKDMKQLLIKISDELEERLKYVPNKSDFVRQAIQEKLDGNTEPSVPSVGITREEVIQLIKEYAPKQEAGFVPKPPDPILGYPCCQLKRPCKHWVWDSGLECYENTLTGEQRKDSSVIDVHEL